MALSLSALQRTDNPAAVSISRGKVGRLLLAANDASSHQRGLKRDRLRLRDAVSSVLASLKGENVKSSIVAQVEDLLLSLGDNSSSLTEAKASEEAATSVSSTVAESTRRHQQQTPPPSSPVASKYALDAIARLDQMQQDLLTRSRCTSPMSPAPVPSSSAELAEAQETIRELEARNALLNKDLQLSLLALNKSSQSRQLAAAHAARSTKFQLAATLSEINPGAGTPDVDDHVKKLTSRLDALQQELDKSLEERQRLDREQAAKNAATEKVVQHYQARVADLERANLELTLKYTSSTVGGGEEERERLVRQIQLLDDLSSKSVRRVDQLDILVSKVKEQLTSAKSADAVLKSLCVLLDLPSPTVAPKVPLAQASPLTFSNNNSNSSSSVGNSGGSSRDKGKENNHPSTAVKTPAPAAAKRSTPSPLQRFGVLTTISPLASLR